ncbi:MAG: di-heme oxidoredictase family protein [Flavobacteriales bacterium]
MTRSPWITIGLLTAWVTIWISGCRHQRYGDDILIANADTLAFAGGDMTYFHEGANAYQSMLPSPSAAADSGRLFFATAFNNDAVGLFHGLGPTYNQTSCMACHPGLGRAHPPTSEVDPGSGLLLRLSLAGTNAHGGPMGIPEFGTQLQTNAIAGAWPEGILIYSLSNVFETYPDGQSYILHQPSHSILNPHAPLGNDALQSLRMGSPVYGVGLLELIPESEIMQRYDETDANADYISGRMNYCWDPVSQTMRFGRFGWKASAADIRHQTAMALAEDMGVNTEIYFPNDVSEGQSNVVGITEDFIQPASLIHQLYEYLRRIQVPAIRHTQDPLFMRGRELFHAIGCEHCHRETLHTGASDLAELSFQTIHPYTDMLIHDMGEVLSDNRPDYAASTNEWRTPPLWGIGQTLLVNPLATFLHDGRATTIEEAILWHGGEAHWSKEDFKQLNAADRAAILFFLQSL